ncbi:hypothetical protein H0E84_12665 [Luteimonas sp. SJ-92]|uniref:Uncharacterized protein n=1 Tax=Luteimonas salinisoli TaxID=2752307 RepID=A0A853JEF6_9GAMM|nr:hypothetical protein [Luteimonas salinisoli]NZA27235.1 hypothetical protein [Luteimonas salinisoli]
MGILRTFALGAVGYLAYRAWRRRRNGTDEALAQEDAGERTSPHGDPVLAGAAIEEPPPPRPAAHSSRGFGET